MTVALPANALDRQLTQCLLLLADVELGLASRSDLLQILNHTVHGGKSVLGVSDGQSDGDKRRLNNSMFQTGTLGNINATQVRSPTSPATTNSTDSPGRLFQMDSSPIPSGLVSSPSALFPVSLERSQSSESMDFALASCNQDPSAAGGNIFQMTDTAHDNDPSVPGVRRAEPPPSPAAAEEQQQRLPQQLLQQQREENDYQQQQPPPAQQGPPPRRKLYAYGIADPEYMSLPCKMSMKHARVTVNHETNSRLYGKKLPGQVITHWAAASMCTVIYAMQ